MNVQGQQRRRGLAIAKWLLVIEDTQVGPLATQVDRLDVYSGDRESCLSNDVRDQVGSSIRPQ